MEDLTQEQQGAVDAANTLLKKFDLVILEIGAPKPPK
jgi:hypothetical protein